MSEPADDEDRNELMLMIEDHFEGEKKFDTMITEFFSD